MRQIFFFNKVAGLRAATSLRKRLSQRCFPVNFVKFLITPFLPNTSGQLLLIFFTGSQFNSWKTIIHLITANNFQNIHYLHHRFINLKWDRKTGVHIFTKIKNTNGWKSYFNSGIPNFFFMVSFRKCLMFHWSIPLNQTDSDTRRKEILEMIRNSGRVFY